MKTLTELFLICNSGNNYTTVSDGAHEVDYKFIEENNILYIFFEPSDGAIDWRINFTYWRKPYKDMEISYRVHGGFLDSWKLVSNVIIEKVKDARWKKIVIVGYSHGAALAALCHEAVWYHRPDLRAKGLVGYGFDGPRVYAGFKVKKELKERWRTFTMFRNWCDIVTHVPFVFMGFRHVGTLERIRSTGGNPGLIGSHLPENVLSGLENYQTRSKL